MLIQNKIYVAGHRGMVGSAIVRQLKVSGFDNIVTRTHAELDLTSQAAVNAFFEQEKPIQVYLAAAKVGGIYANNTYPAQFIYENLMIQANIIKAAHANDVQKLLFLGSSCIYPKAVPQPMREDALLAGTPHREFLHVDDMAAASIFVQQLDKATYDSNTQPMLSHINVGYGSDLTIREVAFSVAEVVSYQGEIEFDATKLDGTMRKLMDSTRLKNLGWQARIDLKKDLQQAYADYPA